MLCGDVIVYALSLCVEQNKCFFGFFCIHTHIHKYTYTYTSVCVYVYICSVTAQWKLKGMFIVCMNSYYTCLHKQVLALHEHPCLYMNTPASEHTL